MIIYFMTYLLFRARNELPFHEGIISLGYFGLFISGIFWVFGFTAAPATLILYLLASQNNILLSGLIAGLGALTGDFIIFKFIRIEFSDEIKKLSKEKILSRLSNFIPKTIKKYLMIVLSCFIIASPLPDEVGVTMLAALTKISNKSFVIISYTLNTVGILVVLFLGKSFT